ncbi:MAG: DUF4389 domain-containing protein [Actinomycetia bacterium]|nr:DUF4389 domain-containing protein [Actinomycetes bacterium]
MASDEQSRVQPPSSQGQPLPDQGHKRSVPVGWIILVVAGAIVSLFSFAPLAGGAFLLWADSTQKDADGFFVTPAERIETTSYAVTSDELDFGADPTADQTAFELGDVVTVRMDAESTTESAIFVGIGPRREVDEYLGDVSRAIITDMSVDPFSVDYDYEGAGAPSGPPGDEDFWVAAAEGNGEQSLEWEPSSGKWSVVVMNADGAEGVSADVAVGAKSPWVFTGGLIATILGGIGVLIGAVLLVVGVIGLATRSQIELGGRPHTGPIVSLEASLDEPVSRWLWLVKWLLLIPHFIVLFVLWIAFAVVTFIAFWAILFTARYPRSLFDFNLGVLRWTWRVVYYGYGALGTDKYPPFTLGPDPDYPATYSVEYPERLSRGLVLVKWWLLAIPHYIVLGVFTGTTIATATGEVSIPGLLSILVFFVAVVLLFVGRYPRGMYGLVMGINRWIYRVIPYVALMRDEYPPFRLDQGEQEPTEARD